MQRSKNKLSIPKIPMSIWNNVDTPLSSFSLPPLSPSLHGNKLVRNHARSRIAPNAGRMSIPVALWLAVSINRTPGHLCHTPAPVVFVTCFVPHVARDYIIFPSQYSVVMLAEAGERAKSDADCVCEGAMPLFRSNSGHLSFQRLNRCRELRGCCIRAYGILWTKHRPVNIKLYLLYRSVCTRNNY